MRSVFDVKQFGATGNGSTDDRPAIQAAIDAAATAGGGTVYLGIGTFLVSKAASQSWCLRLPSKVALVGAGRASSVVTLSATDASANSTAVWLVYVNGNDVTVADLGLDGNKPSPETTAYNAATEQHPGIFVSSSARLQVRNVAIAASGGDGIQIHSGTQDVTITRTAITGCNRSCLHITAPAGQEARNVRLIDCDLVGSGKRTVGHAGVAHDVAILGCRIDQAGTYSEYAVSTAGNATSAAQRWRLVGNEIRGGVLVTFAEGTILQSNAIVVPSSAEAGVYCLSYSRNTIVTGNAIRVTNTATSYPMGVKVVASSEINSSAGLVVTNNTIDCSAAHASANGVYVDGCTDVLVSDNQLVGPGSTSAGGNGVQIRSTCTIRAAIVKGNRISNFGQYGINIVGYTSQLLALDISRNAFDRATGGMTTAIRLTDSAGALQVAQVTLIGNDAVAGITTLVDQYPANVPVVIGGNRGASAIYSITGTPESAVAAPIGSIAYRRDGSAGTTMYVKESGSGTTGWVAK